MKTKTIIFALSSLFTFQSLADAAGFKPNPVVMNSGLIYCVDALKPGHREYINVRNQILEMIDEAARISEASNHAIFALERIMEDGVVIDPDQLVSAMAVLSHASSGFSTQKLTDYMQSKMFIRTTDGVRPWSDVYGILSRKEISKQVIQMNPMTMTVN